MFSPEGCISSHIFELEITGLEEGWSLKRGLLVSQKMFSPEGCISNHIFELEITGLEEGWSLKRGLQLKLFTIQNALHAETLISNKDGFPTISENDAMYVNNDLITQQI